MKRIDNMVGDSIREKTTSYISEKDKKRLSAGIMSSVAALVFLIAGYIFSKIYPSQTIISEMIYLVSVVIIGLPVLITAVRGFLQKDVGSSMEILVSIAMVVSVLDGRFIVAILIPVILTLVHFFEEKSIMGGRDAIEGLKRMQADTALIQVDGEEKEVDAKTLSAGDVIIIKPGMGVPIDGTVIKGEANMDQKSLTGESMPKEVVSGDKVYAGTTDIDGLLTVRVDKAYVDTSFNRIVQLLEQAEGMSLSETRLIDRFMLYYIPIVLVLATLIWLFTKDISKAVAVLVVSCPCGYMLVSSAPIIAALGVAAKRGVLIKNPAFIEKLTDVDCFAFDKTGTITGGELEAVEVKTFGGHTEDEIIYFAASVAHGSLHPASKAVMRLCGDRGYDEDFIITETAGNGVVGEKDGVRVVLGNDRFLKSLDIALPEAGPAYGSTSWVALGDTAVGCIVFRDILRDDVEDAFSALRELGITDISVLTGDNKTEADKIAQTISADEMLSELLPEKKLEVIRQKKADHIVAVVGDGINDSLALSESDVGIAMGAMGSDTAIQSADISLMNNSLMNLPFTVMLARKTKEIIDQNIIIAFLTSFVMIFLAACGIVTPIAGAFLHNAGAFIVLFNSARIIREKYELKSFLPETEAEEVKDHD